MSFGEKLRDLRLEKEFTTSQLADDLFRKYELKVSGSALGKYERNERQPDFKVLTILAEYYNVSLDWLFDRTTYKQLCDDIIKSINNDDYTLITASRLLIDHFIDIDILDSYDHFDENFVYQFKSFMNSFVTSLDNFKKLNM